MILKSREDRNKKVLGIIVRSYIYNARPVSSNAVAEMLGFSSATIRNIMVELEDSGFISHPHTSAGRMPTDAGYRYYVDSLMRLHSLATNTADRIKSEYHKMKTFEEVVKKSTEILSKITNYTSIAVLPAFKRNIFSQIGLYHLYENRVHVILATEGGMLTSFDIELKNDASRDELDIIANFLNDNLTGMDLQLIEEYLVNRLDMQRDNFYRVIEDAVDIIRQTLLVSHDDKLFLEAPSGMFDQPEFKDITRMQKLLKVLEDKDRLRVLISESANYADVSVHIGSENKYKDIKEFSIVTSNYRISDKVAGSVGVIGPTRMEYEYVIPAVKYLANLIEGFLKESLR